MTPPQTQIVLDTAVIALGLGLSLLSLARRSIPFAHRAGVAVAVLVLAAWSLRFWSAGHFPIFGAYESALSLACFGGLALWLVGLRSRQPLAWLFPAMAALLLLHGGLYSREIWALTISERGFWVHLHAIFAFAAFALGMCLVSASILVFRGYRPPLRPILLGFAALYALNIVSGSYYRFLLFGVPWSFDPIEAINLACFLAFTTLIHMVSFRRWSPKKTAAWSIVCFVFLVLAYRLILVFPSWSSYHILDIGIRTHIMPD